MSRPNSYDMRQMRRVRNQLREALKHAEWMCEARSLIDVECRAIVVAQFASAAAVNAARVENRFHKEAVSQAGER